MKILFLLTALVVTGCTWFGSDATEGQRLGESTELDSQTANAPDAAPSPPPTATLISEFAYEQRTQLVDLVTKDLELARQALDRLTAEVEAATGQAKIEAQAALATAKARWSHAKAQLEAAQIVNADAWEQSKSGIVQSFLDLQNSVEQTNKCLKQLR